MTPEVFNLLLAAGGGVAVVGGVGAVASLLVYRGDKRLFNVIDDEDNFYKRNPDHQPGRVDRVPV